MKTLLSIIVAGAVAHGARAQTADTVRVDYSPARCPSCAEWSAPTPARRIFGNVFYVGTRGLSAVLLTSSQDHILIDAGLPASAPIILENIRSLGFRAEDIRLIVNSHAHYDHAGGIAAIQRASGARVAARQQAAAVLRTGTSSPDDPQFGLGLPYPPVQAMIRTVSDGDTLQVGPITITAHATGGHMPGGTSWSWRSCEGSTCLDFVYADSQTPVSNDTFRFSGSPTYPDVLQDFRRGQETLENLSCDVLLTPHPSASRMFERLRALDEGTVPSLSDREGCRRYVATARQLLKDRLAKESGKR